MATITRPEGNIVATQRDVIIPRSLIDPQSSIPVTTAPTPGDLNPISRRTTVKWLNVNTANRSRMSRRGATAPALSSRSTNCTLDLVSPVRDVLSICPINLNLPSAPYAISASKSSSMIWILVDSTAGLCIDSQVLGCTWRLAFSPALPSHPGCTWYSLQVSDGNYRPGELEETLNQALEDAGLCELFQVAFDKHACSFSLHTVGDAVKAIAFATERSVEGSLGWIMGFRDRYYAFAGAGLQQSRPLPLGCSEQVRCSKKCFPALFDKTRPAEREAGALLTSALRNESATREEVALGSPCSIYSESTFSLFGSSYLMLCVDDYQSNVDQLFLPDAGANLQTDRIGARQNALARIDFEFRDDRCTLKTRITPSKRVYFGPVTLEKLKVMLIDSEGNQVDLNHSDFSFCLEIESFYKF